MNKDEIAEKRIKAAMTNTPYEYKTLERNILILPIENKMKFVKYINWGLVVLLIMTSVTAMLIIRLQSDSVDNLTKLNNLNQHNIVSLKYNQSKLESTITELTDINVELQKEIEFISLKNDILIQNNKDYRTIIKQFIKESKK